MHVQEENLWKARRRFKGYFERSGIANPYETGLIKESSPYVRYSQKIYRGMLPKPELKKPALSGRVGLEPKRDELQLR